MHPPLARQTLNLQVLQPRPTVTKLIIESEQLHTIRIACNSRSMLRFTYMK